MGARFSKYNFTKSLYYQMPKALFLIRKYHDGLSIEAKVIYSILLDKVSLSYNNGFFEENGDIFLYYKWDDLMDLTAIKKTTFYAAVKQLRELNLIHTVKKPFSNANKIYVSMLDDAETDADIIEDKSFSEFYSKSNIEEIETINKVASMDGFEMREAINDGHLGVPGEQKPKKTVNSASQASRTNGFAMRTTPGSIAENHQNVAKVSSYSELTGSYSELTGSDSELSSSHSGKVGSHSGKDGSLYELLNSKTNSIKPNSKNQSVKERLEDRKRGETPTGADSESSSVAHGQITSSEADGDDFAQVFNLYDENIQSNPVPLVKAGLKNLYSKYGKDILVEAITQTALSSTAQEKKGFNYVASVAERLAGKKNNNYTNKSKSADVNDSSLNSITTMPHKSLKPSMEDSQKNIHGMLEQYFTANAGNMSEGTNGL